jgi:ATP-binding cassette, subfamily B, bacterial
MNGENPYIALLKTAWRYARHQKSRYLLIYGLFIMANVVASLNPLLFGWFVDAVQREGTQVWSNAWLYAGAYMLLKLGEWIFHGPARLMERELAFNLSRNFLDEMYHQTLHLPVRWHQDHHSGATINRIRKAYEALKNFFQGSFMYIHAISKFVFSFGAMLYFSPLYGGIGILLGILTIWVIFKFDKPFIETLDQVNEREHVVSSTLFDSLSNIITVITLRLEKRMQHSLLQKVAAVLPPFRRNVLINEWKWFVADLLVALTYAVVAVGYVYQHHIPGEVFLVGGLVTLLGYVNQFTSVFHDIAWQYTEIVQYNTDVQTARSIGEAYADHHRPEATNEWPASWKRVEISGLSFSHGDHYDASQQGQGLHELNLRLERGKKVAFIGESGSGKSTLLALLRGLYEAENGVKVAVDGKQLSGLAVISDTVTLFPQEPEIFENTIEYNITLGLPFDRADVMHVCQTAFFGEVVAQLPNGLESNIQEKGVNLSGGQKQRLALARGVLAARSSDIVLLDEPTSSVDAKTEVQIYDRLFEEFKGKAVMSSLHRLHLLAKFDYVYVMQGGRIADQGTFEDLRRRSPIFQELWKHQENAKGQAESFRETV